MKVAIIGAGAMGCRFGAALAQSGAQVVLCDVWKEHVDAINRNGLRVSRQGRDSFVRIPAAADMEAAADADAVIVFTKSMHTEDAVKQAVKIIGGDTPVATFQNGLGNIAVLERYVGRRRIIAGITNYPTDLIGPGAVCTDGTGFTKLMALDGACRDMSAALCRLLKDSGMSCELSEDILKEIWEKVAFNSAMNTITALTRQRVGRMGGSPYGFELCCLIAREVCGVARAEGVAADYDRVEATFKKVLDPRESGNHITSMLQDVVKQKPTEIDSICGEVIRAASGHGIKTPYLRAVYNLIKVTEENYAAQIFQLGE